MKKFEYMLISLSPDYKAELELLNSHGKQGWELIMMRQSSPMAIKFYYFKRELNKK